MQRYLALFVWRAFHLFWCKGTWTGTTSWSKARMLKDVLNAYTYVMVFVCPISGASILKALMVMPGESADKWSLSCNLPSGGWMERVCLLRGWGDEDRGDCRWERLERKRVRSFLLWSWTESWISSEVRYAFVCVSLNVYLQTFQLLNQTTPASPFKLRSSPSEWKQAGVEPVACEHTFQVETHISLIISTAQANGCY